jgi:regulator of sigma E protease
VAGEEIERYGDLHRMAARRLKGAAPPVRLEVTYRLRVADRPTGKDTVTLDQAAAEVLRRTRWNPPVSAGQFQTLQEPVRAAGPLEALAMGTVKTGETMHRVYLTLRRLLEGSVQIKHMQGPVGITDTGVKVARRGTAYLLFFFGLISVNLAVINFLPIPVVDGGHLLFVLIEKVKGSPVGPRVQQAALVAGLALILSVFLTVTFYDVLRVFGFQ